jgi:hypothetical protein
MACGLAAGRHGPTLGAPNFRRAPARAAVTAIQPFAFEVVFSLG